MDFFIYIFSIWGWLRLLKTWDRLIQRMKFTQQVTQCFIKNLAKNNSNNSNNYKIIRFGRRTWWLAWRRCIFLAFLPFVFDFFLFLIYGVSTASGLGWTISTEFTTFVLLDDPCKLIFLTVVPSSASAFVFYIGASITEIRNGPSLIIFLVMFMVRHN